MGLGNVDPALAERSQSWLPSQSWMLGKTIQKSQVLGQSQMLEAERSTDPEHVEDDAATAPELAAATGRGSKGKMANFLVFSLNPIRDLRELTPGGGRERLVLEPEGSPM